MNDVMYSSKTNEWETPQDGRFCKRRVKNMLNNDLISRAAAIDEIEEYLEEYSELEPETGYHNLKWCAMEEAKDALLALPAVDAVTVIHARWIHLDPRECATISGKCSCCGWEAHYYEDDVADMPYCPNCGAKMDE